MTSENWMSTLRSVSQMGSIKEDGAPQRQTSGAPQRSETTTKKFFNFGGTFDVDGLAAQEFKLCHCGFGKLEAAEEVATLSFSCCSTVLMARASATEAQHQEHLHRRHARPQLSLGIRPESLGDEVQGKSAYCLQPKRIWSS